MHLGIYDINIDKCIKLIVKYFFLGDFFFGGGGLRYIWINTFSIGRHRLFGGMSYSHLAFRYI